MKIIIIGAGPVGLYLGCLLRKQGIECSILERRTVRSTHSRSIGIHPPALRKLQRIGVAETLVSRGIPVREGEAFAEKRPIGSLSFDSLPAPFPFVLSIPQHITESVLEDLFESMGEPVVRNVEVTGLEQMKGTIAVKGADRVQHADRVIACDGRRSMVRDLLGVGFNGRPYDAHFVMGDFPDTTSFGTRAAIYLGRDGLVESFPLPGDVRRWVARLKKPVDVGTERTHLLSAVVARTGFDLSEKPALMTSSFTAERFEAERFFVGGVALAGDAAHVISPIGGQGMNLGWMDADWLADWCGRGAPPAELDTYESRRRMSFRKAARRSELNMSMGTPGPLFPLRRLAARTMVSGPFRKTFARIFTMNNI